MGDLPLLAVDVGQAEQLLVGDVVDELVAVGVGLDRDDVLQVAESGPRRGGHEWPEVLGSGLCTGGNADGVSTGGNAGRGLRFPGSGRR